MGQMTERYVIFWWVNQVPYMAVFDDEDEADTAARNRNALFIEIGDEIRAFDYYRRDDSGQPMPVILKDLTMKTISRVGYLTRQIED